MCLPENEKILKRELYDLFYMGLINTHKRVIKLQNIRTIEEAVTIVEGSETNSNLETSNNNSKQIRRFSELQENEDLNISKPKNGKFPKYKYCKYHKWCGHTTEECTKINTNKKGVYSIKETTIVPQRIEVTGQINDITTLFVIDSGSFENIMSKQKVTELNLKIEKN
ncbi:hypothetical protein HERIO_2580 [Hepatospora eriocheir]|uniref:Uncharacterized protein n=1 Tax=Hepatospora eriocheir TaxID=1081669 RepID=A0A1X0Q6D1_9MICR|nr:hypothetical protein HERIO_2580 [Hepatospora eriocheir]